jgi:hypothetical protein
MWHALVGVQLLKSGAREAGLTVIRQGLEAFPGNPELTRLEVL